MIGFTAPGGNDKLKLLWTHPNPSNGFAAQTLALDLSKYKYVLIEGTYATTQGPISRCLCPTDSSTSYISFPTSVTATAVRQVVVSPSGINFSNGYFVATSAPSQNQTWYAVPLKIYGMSSDLI